MTMHDSADTQEAVQRWNPEIMEWRVAADEGRLLLKQCRNCSRVHYYPRTLCPFCFGETTWLESRGTGEVYSFAIEHRGAEPLIIAYVKLSEGPIVMTNIVGLDDLGKLRIGSAVQMNTEVSRQARAPMFSLAAVAQ